MRVALFAVVSVVGLIFSFRPLVLDSVIKSVRSRTPGVFNRFPNLSFYKTAPFSSFQHSLDPFISNAAPHSFCEIADPEAYRQIVIDADQDILEFMFQQLMNIVRRPCLGHFVKRIEYLHQTEDGAYSKLAHQRDLSADDMRLLKRAVANAGFKDGNEEDVMSMLMQASFSKDVNHRADGWCSFGNWDNSRTYITQLLTALFVSLAPNLETIAMTQPFQYHIELEEGETPVLAYPLVQVLKYANSRPEGIHFLQKLREVYLINIPPSYSDSRFYSHATDLIACLELFNKLPLIESIGIDVFEPNEDHGKFTGESKSSNITKIHINHSSLSSDYLLLVMETSKIITELQYTTGGRATNDGSHPVFNPKAFIKGLSAHRHTLKVLDIDTDTLTSTYPGELRAGGSYLVDWDKWGGPDQFDPDDYDAEDLNEDNFEFQSHQYLVSIWDRNVSLKDFVTLQELSIGIRFLIYFAQGVETDDAKRSSVMLVDSLPDSLESLTIRGYQKGVNQEHDAQVAALMTRFESGSMRLKEIQGVEELIPNGEDVENPDEDEHLLWSLIELGYSEY